MPVIHGIAVNALRPTQITVGMAEVHDKKKHLESLADHPKQVAEFLADHPIPVVAGANQKYFVIDHHHLGRAMWDAGVDGASLTVVADLSKLDNGDFWREMDRQHWVHPYDDKGRKQDFDRIPHHLKELADDPYRSLAAFVRNADGYDKTQKPFAEFVWADFFRPRITLDLLRSDFNRAVSHGLALAGSDAAAKLPGFIKRAG